MKLLPDLTKPIGDAYVTPLSVHVTDVSNDGLIQSGRDRANRRGGLERRAVHDLRRERDARQPAAIDLSRTTASATRSV